MENNNRRKLGTYQICLIALAIVMNVIGGQIQEHGFCAVAEQAQYLSDHLLGKLQVQVIILGNFQELSR